MKTIKTITLALIIGFIAFNMTTLKVNIKTSDLSINTIKNIALADEEGGGGGDLKLCFEFVNLGGIASCWQCVPCQWWNFARPWGRSGYCLP